MEEIRFNDSGKKISVTIDKETQTIPIQEIDKFKTFITLNRSLNTSLNEKIELNASLKYLPYDVQTENLEYIDNGRIDIEYTETTEDEEDDGTITINNWDTGAENMPFEAQACQVDLNGVVNITIYYDKKIYYQKDVLFTKGLIKDSIINKLPIGDYNAVINFAGNKYLQPSSLNIDFSIEKRMAFFVFDEDGYSGEPGETIVVSGCLKDSITKKVIKDCSIQYDFNGRLYSTKTNSLGDAYFDISIPDVDISHCNLQNIETEFDINDNEPGEEYKDEPEVHLDFDDDGNIIEIDDEVSDVPVIEDNDAEALNDATFYLDSNGNDMYSSEDYDYAATSYLLSISTDNISYYIENADIYVTVKKLLTSVEISQTSEVINNIVTLEGKVMAHYKNQDRNAIYGHIVISLDDTDYISNKINIDEYGEFNTTIDFDEVNLSVNQSDITELIPYKRNLSQDTITDITVADSFNVGEAITAVATVHTTKIDDNIQDGMVVFVLETDGKTVYRYGSQIDSIGQAVFFMNTSKKATYKLYAHYYGLFGYNESDSEIKTIEVI